MDAFKAKDVTSAAHSVAQRFGLTYSTSAPVPFGSLTPRTPVLVYPGNAGNYFHPPPPPRYVPFTPSNTPSSYSKMMCWGGGGHQHEKGLEEHCRRSQCQLC